MVRRLDIVTYNEIDYYVDYRLSEFRPVRPPLEFISFDSDQGGDMLLAINNINEFIEGGEHNDDDMDSTVPLPRA